MTHDADVAEACDRVIRVRDGLVESDRRTRSLISLSNDIVSEAVA